MGGEEGTGRRPQGAVRRQGLRPKGVGPVIAQMAALQAGSHGGLIHQGAPGGVQQDGPRLHLGQGVGTDQPPGGGGGGTVEADDVALGQQGVQIHKGHPVASVGRAHRPGPDQHLHPKGQGQPGGLTADVAVAADAEGLAVQLHLGQDAVGGRHFQLPVAVPNRPVLPLRALADGQQQAEGHLGHAVGGIGRHIGHADPVPPAGRQIQIVGAGGEDPHPLQVGALGQDFLIHPALVQHHQLGVPDPPGNLIVGGADVLGDIRHQGPQPRPVQVPRLHDVALQNNQFHL